MLPKPISADFILNISKLKINCASISPLISRPKGNNPPTEKEWKEFFQYVSREYCDITERQKFITREIVSKAIDYDPEKLSDTVRAELCKIYSYEVYGKSALNAGGTKPFTLDKGNLAEPDAIKLLSRLDGVEYVKNQRLISNRWFKGIPDILIGKYKKYVTAVKEIKTSYDLPAFLSLLNKPCESDNIWQMTGYLDILQLDEGEICHCLVNMPESMIKDEEKRVADRCQKLNLEEAEVEKRLFQLKASMVYDEIPEELRVVRFTVTKDKVRIRMAHDRVKLARVWLKELHESFQKSINLVSK